MTRKVIIMFVLIVRYLF